MQGANAPHEKHGILADNSSVSLRVERRDSV